MQTATLVVTLRPLDRLAEMQTINFRSGEDPAAAFDLRGVLSGPRQVVPHDHSLEQRRAVHCPVTIY